MPTIPDSADNEGDWVDDYDLPYVKVPVTFIPDASRYSADREAAIQAFKEQAARQLKSEQVHSTIRRDPVGYFAHQNKRTWAVDQLEEMGPIWTFHWGGRRSQMKEWKDQLAASKWAFSWPLPVGRKSLAMRVEEIKLRNQVGYFGDWSFLRDRMPFAGEELALAVIEFDVAGYHLEAFGLGVPDDERDELFRVSTVKFRVTGEGPAPKEVQRYTKNISSWWGMQAGNPIRGDGGRPRKDIPYSVAEVAWWQMREMPEYIDIDPTDRQFRDRLHDVTGVYWSQETLNRRRQEWSESGMTWPPKDES